MMVLWWFLVVLGGSWWFLVLLGVSGWFLVVLGGLWCNLVVGGKNGVKCQPRKNDNLATPGLPITICGEKTYACIKDNLLISIGYCG